MPHDPDVYLRQGLTPASDVELSASEPSSLALSGTVTGATTSSGSVSGDAGSAARTGSVSGVTTSAGVVVGVADADVVPAPRFGVWFTWHPPEEKRGTVSGVTRSTGRVVGRADRPDPSDQRRAEEDELLLVGAL